MTLILECLTMAADEAKWRRLKYRNAPRAWL